MRTRSKIRRDTGGAGSARRVQPGDAVLSPIDNRSDGRGRLLGLRRVRRRHRWSLSHRKGRWNRRRGRWRRALGGSGRRRYRHVRDHHRGGIIERLEISQHSAFAGRRHGRTATGLEGLPRLRDECLALGWFAPGYRLCQFPDECFDVRLPLWIGWRQQRFRGRRDRLAEPEGGGYGRLTDLPAGLSRFFRSLSAQHGRPLRARPAQPEPLVQSSSHRAQISPPALARICLIS